jgi:hypothetical protein
MEGVVERTPFGVGEEAGDFWLPDMYSGAGAPSVE